MNRWGFLLQTLRHRLGVQFLTVLVMGIGTAVLVASFLVGHSMTRSLEEAMERRLGSVSTSLSLGDRFVTENLLIRMKERGVNPIGAIHSRGKLLSRESGHSLGGIQVWGVPEEFWSLWKNGPQKTGVLINPSLAKRLEIDSGDRVLLKLLHGGAGVSETVVGTMDSDPKSIELTIDGVIGAHEFGDFHLLANQMPPYNLFVPLADLAEALQQKGRINHLLSSEKMNPEMDLALAASLSLDDLEMQLVPLEGGGWEARSTRVFLEDAWGEGSNSTLFTYLSTSVMLENRRTPYPIISGLKGDGPLGSIPRDSIVLTDWMAKDLNAKVGDEVTLKYAWLDPLHRLKDRERPLKVHDIIPVDSSHIDASMMPDFPGLKDSEHCRDWEVGFKMDLESIREKDEEYWDTYRGRPKAFINFETAQDLWTNRFGNRTALRFSEKNREDVVSSLLERLSPSSLGMIWQDHRTSGQEANAGAMDFSGLFMGFSLFISIASIALMHMLFRFRLEGDSETISLQTALGFSPKQIRQSYMTGFLILSIPGLLLGVVLGHGFGFFLLERLGSQWQDAIGDWNLSFHSGLEPSLYGALTGWFISWISIWPTLRKVSKPKQEETTRLQKRRPWIGWLSIALSLPTLAKMMFSPGSSADFFILGSLLMVAWISISRYVFSERPLPFGRISFMLSQMSRRSSRSLAVVLMMAVGAFMVLSLEAFRILPDNDTSLKSSGSGGFQLLLKLERGLERDLNDVEVQEQLGLNSELLKDTSFYPLRYSRGEDASCLNLNRAQRPNLIGIDPKEFNLSQRFSFVAEPDGDKSWLALESGGSAIPIIGDQNTLMYSLGLSMGSSFSLTGENGESIEFVVVGTLAPSIFQDALLVDRERLLEAFPSTKGFEKVMAEVSLNDVENIQRELNIGLESHGADTILTQDQLMAFHRVQNSYLSIFQSLGWLGLGLGCAGLFLVILQNIQDRRSEIGLWTALGKTLPAIRKEFMLEHSLLFMTGLGGGMLCGLLAIAPLVSGQGESLSLLNMFGQFLILVSTGILSLLLGLFWLKPKPLLEAEN